MSGQQCRAHPLPILPHQADKGRYGRLEGGYAFDFPQSLSFRAGAERRTRKPWTPALASWVWAGVHGFRVRGRSLSSGRAKRGPGGPRPGMTALPTACIGKRSMSIKAGAPANRLCQDKKRPAGSAGGS
jgi:hypothetical protein